MVTGSVQNKCTYRISDGKRDVQEELEERRRLGRLGSGFRRVFISPGQVLEVVVCCCGLVSRGGDVLRKSSVFRAGVWVEV